MNQAFRLKMAKQSGERLVRDLGIKSLPVDPFVIAKNHGIMVQAKPDTAAGVSGMLLRNGNNFGIMYATHIDNEGFQRFSVAHELGHYFLEGHIDHVLSGDGVHASHAGFISGDPYELEADQFAAGLLMPGSMFSRAIGKHEPGLAAIESLAGLCRTSLTATAIRYSELTDDAVAVAISTGQTIDFCCLSDGMKSLKQLTWLKKGSPVPSGTATAHFNADPARIATAERDENDIDTQDWLGGNRSVPATEEIVGLGGYGKTLTVLSCPSIIDDSYRDEDEDDEEALSESWTPRFRR